MKQSGGKTLAKKPFVCVATAKPTKKKGLVPIRAVSIHDRCFSI
jgi:hypothetical protein